MPGVAVSPVGAPGRVAGVADTVFDTTYGNWPRTITKQYVVPLVKPFTR